MCRSLTRYLFAISQIIYRREMIFNEALLIDFSKIIFWNAQARLTADGLTMKRSTRTFGEVRSEQTATVPCAHKARKETL
jgi:hypothetical protein